VNIEGTVASSELGDFIQINSNPKVSQIVDGKYKFVGVEAGTHTISLRGKSENGDTVIKASQEIQIVIDEIPSIEGNKVTIKTSLLIFCALNTAI
jgi:hypothetical protein